MVNFVFCFAVEKPNAQSQRFKVWVPTLQDIALVFLNMGASFISLFPLEALQPPFTEGDLLYAFNFSNYYSITVTVLWKLR